MSGFVFRINIKMDEPLSNNIINLTGISGTLQDIAYKIVEDQLSSSTDNDNVTKERTIFVLGSKGVVSLVLTYFVLLNLT